MPIAPSVLLMAFLLGCAPRPVPARALTYPVLALETYGPAVYADEAAFCTTTENGQDRYRLMVVLDARCVRYTVTEAVVQSRSTHWLLDLVDGGRSRVLSGLQADGRFRAVLDRFAGACSFKSVLAQARGEADRRSGVSPDQSPRSGPPR